MGKFRRERVAGPRGIPGVGTGGMGVPENGATGNVLVWSGAPAWVQNRVFDIRHYGGSIALADNIAAINAAINAASASGGGRVVFSPGGTFAVRPDPATANFIKLKSNVTLDLGDATLRVANDTPPYAKLIGQADTTVSVDNVRVTGGTIDQNPDGNTTSNITVAANQSNAINLSTFNGVLIDDVSFIGNGINTVVLSGPPVGAIDAAVLNCTFRFMQGASTTPDYDNSSIYLTATGQRVHGCRFASTLAEKARGACEFHGHLGSFTGNTVENFQTMLNIVYPSSEPSPAIHRLGITCVGNSGTGLNYGIQLWPTTGKVISNVLIANNVLAMNQIDWALTGTSGIGVNRSTTNDGESDGVTIANNIIAFQAGDARTGMSHVDSFGINTNGNGAMRNLVIANNTILNAPAYGIKVGDSSYSAKAVTRAMIRDNMIVDAGQNPNMAQRVAIVVTATLNDVDIRHNMIQDTGASALVGSHSYLITGLVGGARNRYENNTVRTASGLAMTASSADTYFQYLQKKQTIDLASIPADSSATITFTVPGAALEDFVIAQPLQGLEAGLAVTAGVTAANTVVVRVTNTTAVAIDPVVRVWRVRVLKSGIDA